MRATDFSLPSAPEHRLPVCAPCGVVLRWEG